MRKNAASSPAKPHCSRCCEGCARMDAPPSAPPAREHDNSTRESPRTARIMRIRVLYMRRHPHNPRYVLRFALRASPRVPPPRHPSPAISLAPRRTDTTRSRLYTSTRRPVPPRSLHFINGFRWSRRPQREERREEGEREREKERAEVNVDVASVFSCRRKGRSRDSCRAVHRQIPALRYIDCIAIASRGPRLSVSLLAASDDASLEQIHAKYVPTRINRKPAVAFECLDSSPRTSSRNLLADRKERLFLSLAAHLDASTPLIDVSRSRAKEALGNMREIRSVKLLRADF